MIGFKDKSQFELRFEKMPYSISEKKVLTPTMRILRTVLHNIYQTRGVWCLKTPHQTRKKGPERFFCLRLDRAGRGLRIRTKPGGNETCYEYTLVPPDFVDLDGVFEALCRIHPSSLKLADENVSKEDIPMIAALVQRTMDPPMPIISPIAATPPPKPATFEQIEKILDVAAERIGLVSNAANKKLVELPSEAQSEPVSHPETTETFAPSAGSVASLNKMSSLDISGGIVSDEEEEESLCCQYVLDRALVAFSFVCEAGFAKRADVSESIVTNLNVPGFLRSHASYGSLKGAMKSLMAGLCREGFTNRTYQHSVLTGYRLTQKGEKRIIALMGFLDEKLSSRIRSDWSDWIPDEEEEEEELMFAEHVEKAPEEVQKPSEIDSDTIQKLKMLIGEFEDQEEQVAELEKMISDLKSDKEDDTHTLVGIDAAKKEKLKAKEELERDILRLDSRRQELEQKISKKQQEIAGWEAELSSHAAKKADAESQIASAGWRRS